MSRASLPPYFAAVALASTLVCGALMAVQLHAGTIREAVELVAGGGEGAGEAGGQDTLPKPKVPRHQTIDFVHLRNDVEIDKTTLSRKRIRHRLRPLRRVFEALEADGVSIGVYLRDLGTGNTFSYGATDFFYPASSIKGPYVICVFERMVDAGSTDAETARRLASAIIIDSDNDAYRELRRICGNEVFAQWAVDGGAIQAGSKSYDRYATKYYPRCTPRQMGLLWEQAFAYLDAPSESSRFLVEQFDQRVESPMRKGLSPDFVTIAKAGWYPADEGERYTATADAGIVFDGEHAYVLVVMTDLADDLERLASLMPSVWSAARVLR